jgi:hypothetical protein
MEGVEETSLRLMGKNIGGEMKQVQKSAFARCSS